LLRRIADSFHAWPFWSAGVQIYTFLQDRRHEFVQAISRQFLADKKEFFLDLTGWAGADVLLYPSGFKDGELAQDERMDHRS
jgi:hypothetical protein